MIKNDLAGGVLPSKYFGANAAWLRLVVTAHNVLPALKRLALPTELLTAPSVCAFCSSTCRDGWFTMPGD